MLQENYICSEAGCRKDFSTLVGRMKVNAEPATRRKTQKSTGSTTTQNGAKSDGRFQRPSESWSKKQEPQGRSGSGKEVLLSGHFSMRKWQSEKHKSWSMPVEGFKGHVATDGSLLGPAGKWGACGWSVVYLDCDEEMGPLHGMFGSMEAELEVQRTIKRAELTAFLCLLERVIGPIKVHVDNKGIIDGLRKEKKSVSSQEREMPIYGLKIWKNYMVWQKGAFCWKWSM